MASIASIVERFKREPELYLTDQHILDACAAAGHAWRDRLLGPVLTVRLMVVQMLWGNVSCRRLRRLAELSASVAAYAEARVRLPIDVLGLILWRVNDEARRATHGFGRWLGTFPGASRDADRWQRAVDAGHAGVAACVRPAGAGA